MTLDRLLGALPDQADLTALRQALLRASVLDMSRTWGRSSAYATFDKRVLRTDALRDLIAHSARDEHARIDALYAAVAELLQHVAAGDDAAACLTLIGIGEAAEGRDDLQGAVTYYESAARLSVSSPEHKPRILALRHLARVHLGLGDMDSASSYYRAALEQARASNDVEWQIVAFTGLGNVLSLQGKWREAIDNYETARALCGTGYAHQRAQLAINLASMHREQGDLEQSAAHLAAAADLWSELSRAEQSAWYNNRGLLALASGEFESAETSFRQGLEAAETDFARAMRLDNLAELFIRRGNLIEAEDNARAAEDLALRAQSPRALAEIYTRLGKIFRLRSDLNGVTFFEKALELCRGRSYPFTEANAYLEYGLFRRDLGDVEEARSYLQRARQLCAEIGAEQLGRAAAEAATRI
ncbi:MAG TPA: tetratricopeptide repeat protein [Longimicrobiales bacterium]